MISLFYQVFHVKIFQEKGISELQFQGCKTFQGNYRCLSLMTCHNQTFWNTVLFISRRHQEGQIRTFQPLKSYRSLIYISSGSVTTGLFSALSQ